MPRTRGPREQTKKFATQPPNSRMEKKLSDKRIPVNPKKNLNHGSGTPLTVKTGPRSIANLDEEHPSRRGRATRESHLEPHQDLRDTAYLERIHTQHKHELHGKYAPDPPNQKHI
ncbi:hypothetical protein GEMRC1_004648 [Eukaryota sp. GEM-RC1]